MAPKPSPLQQIRRQVAANRKSTASVKTNSAFHRIEKANERFVHGSAIDRKEHDDFLRFPRPKKVTKSQPKKKKDARPKSRLPAKSSEPAEKVVEYWRPAGGDNMVDDEAEKSAEPTRIIGLARVPAWSAETFKAASKAVIERYGEVQDLVAQAMMDGPEEVADVYAVFRSELVAEVVKDGIEEELVEGRKLRLIYA